MEYSDGAVINSGSPIDKIKGQWKKETLPGYFMGFTTFV